jgi:type II secretory pathway predicted ATPase ExeA
MYKTFWKLDRRPFDNDDEPRFYYPSEIHQATLLKLHYAIENRRGAGLLAGMPGLGKTLLVRALLADLADEYEPRIHVRFPQLGPEQLVAYLAAELTGQRLPSAAVDENLHRMEACLQENTRGGRHAVVVIDDAHLLCGSDAMETLRLLLNYESAWTILLVGQPGLLPALDRMPALEERMSVKCLLQRFSIDESAAYVSHRLLAAGAKDVHTVFQPDALERIHQLADGIPRRINRLADLALLIGFAEEQRTIRAAQVEAVAEELLTAHPAIPCAA